VSEPIELVFQELVVEAAVEAILSNFSVDETEVELARRWPRLDGETIEEAMVEALVERVLTPGPLAPPGPGVDPADLHPSWRSEQQEFEIDPSFAQPKRPPRKPEDSTRGYDPAGVEFVQPKRRTRSGHPRRTRRERDHPQQW
jgi:hypothetical protein